MKPTDDIDLLLLLQELNGLKDSLTRKNMVVDSQIAALNKTIEYFRDTIEEMREEVVQFRGDRQICGQLNLLVDHKPEINNNTETREADEPTLIDKLLQ